MSALISPLMMRNESNLVTTSSLVGFLCCRSVYFNTEYSSWRLLECNLCFFTIELLPKLDGKACSYSKCYRRWIFEPKIEKSMVKTASLASIVLFNQVYLDDKPDHRSCLEISLLNCNGQCCPDHSSSVEAGGFCLSFNSGNEQCCMIP